MHQKLRSAKIGIALAAIGTLGALVGSASAATWTVENTDDSGTGSLRAAVAQAGDGDTIVFADGLSGTILLQTDVEIDASITIGGPGASVLTITPAVRNERIFTIGTADKDIDVTIAGLALVGARTTINGGAILSAVGNGRTLTVRDCVFRNNNVSPTAYSGTGGGAIFTSTASDRNGALVVTGSLFVGNSSQSAGGAIHYNSSAPLTVSDSTFRRNTAYYYGGAIYLNDEDTLSGTPAVDVGTSVIETSTFSGSSTDDEGGTIMMANRTPALRISDSVFTNSTSESSGAAIYHNGEYGLTVERSRFAGNAGLNDGAINSQPYAPMRAPLTITDSVFEGNAKVDGYGDGGSAIHRSQDGAVTITRTVMRNNNDAYSGAVLFIGSGDIDLTMTDSAIVENVASGWGYAGGLYWGSEGEAIISNTTIASNNAGPADGGGIYVNEGTMLLDSVTITDNQSNNGAAGVYVSSGAVTVRNSIIAGNVSSGDYGNCYGTLIFAGGNGTSILGETGINSSCVDVNGSTPLTGVDPKLGELRESALVGETVGSTWIVPLEAGSPAIDAGATTLTTDQRGVARPVTGTDIGAVEMRPAALAVTLEATRPRVPLGDAAALFATATNTGDFATSPATLAVGLPAAFLAFAPPSAGVDCTAVAGGATCGLGSLAGEEQVAVGIDATTTAAGDTTATALLSAANLADATASAALSIVGGSGGGGGGGSNSGSSTPAATTASTAPAPTAARRTPTIRIAAAPRIVDPVNGTLVTTIAVDGPGRISQVGAIVPGGRAASAACRGVRVARTAGSYAVVCRLTASARAQLRQRPLRLRIVTRFAAQDGGTTTAVRTVIVPRTAERIVPARPSNVTG